MAPFYRQTMSSNAIGFLLAGLVALGVIKALIGRLKPPSDSGFDAIVDEARALGFEGPSLREGMVRNRDGLKMQLRLGSHRLSRVGSSGSTHSEMLVIAIDSAASGRWWIASNNLASRSADALGDHAPCPGGAFVYGAGQDLGYGPWSQAELMEQCHALGLELATSSDIELEAKFAPYPRKGLNLQGRIEKLVDCTQRLGAAAA